MYYVVVSCAIVVDGGCVRGWLMAVGLGSHGESIDSEELCWAAIVIVLPFCVCEA